MKESLTTQPIERPREPRKQYMDLGPRWDLASDEIEVLCGIFCSEAQKRDPSSAYLALAAGVEYIDLARRPDLVKRQSELSVGLTAISSVMEQNRTFGQYRNSQLLLPYATTILGAKCQGTITHQDLLSIAQKNRVVYAESYNDATNANTLYTSRPTDTKTSDKEIGELYELVVLMLLHHTNHIWYGGGQDDIDPLDDDELHDYYIKKTTLPSKNLIHIPRMATPRFEQRSEKNPQPSDVVYITFTHEGNMKSVHEIQCKAMNYRRSVSGSRKVCVAIGAPLHGSRSRNRDSRVIVQQDRIAPFADQLLSPTKPSSDDCTLLEEPIFALHGAMQQVGPAYIVPRRTK